MTDTARKPPRYAPRQYGPPLLSAWLPGVLGKAVKRYGFARPDILARWPEIVGPALARQTMPERLRYAASNRKGQTSGEAPPARSETTLLVRAAGAAALELQHLEPQILERINTYYGYRAVSRLKLVQGPLPPRAAAGRARGQPLSAAAAARLEEKTQAIEDPALRAALARLGKGVYGREGRSPS